MAGSATSNRNMGLTGDVFEFGDRPPSEEELKAHLRDVAGDDRGLESLTTLPRDRAGPAGPVRVELSCMFDPVTRPYACAFLIERGGIPIDGRTGEPRAYVLPPYVSQPWLALPLWRRFGIRVGYLVTLERRANEDLSA